MNNFTSIFSGSGKSSTNVQTGDPILFDFGGLGIRSIERVGEYYVIIAGLFEGAARRRLISGTVRRMPMPTLSPRVIT